MAKIDEVAKAAGVSISTVSYALSGKRPVAADTRRRIEAAVRELGYRPNAGARMLAGRRTQIFALTEPLRTDTHVPTHMSFVLATAVAARRHDYDILLLTDEEAVAGMSRVAASGLVDAILVLDVAPDDPRARLARTIATPTVFIGIPDDSDGLVCVDLDFAEAGRMALDRVADLGHTVVGLLGQTDVAYEKSNFPPRVHGAVRDRAAERGVRLLFASTGATRTDRDGTRRAISRMLDAGATAILLHAPDDVHAVLLRELAERGLSVPADVSLVSIGSSFRVEELPRPVDLIPLIPEESCSRAVELAQALLDVDPPDPGIRLIAPRYHDHGTTAPAAGGGAP